MSGPLALRKLRTADFPQGIATPQDFQRLAAVINPMLEAQKTLSNNGVSLGQNLDAQVVSFSVQTPVSDWIGPTSQPHPFVLIAGTNTVGQELSWRKDAFGATWLRGKLATVPALTTAIATLPASAWPSTVLRYPADANGGYGAVEISAAGVLAQVAGSVAGTLD